VAAGRTQSTIVVVKPNVGLCHHRYGLRTIGDHKGSPLRRRLVRLLSETSRLRRLVTIFWTWLITVRLKELHQMDTRLNRRQLVIGAAGLSAAVLASNPLSLSAQGTPWELLAPTTDAPPPRWDHHLAGDADEGVLLLYGGRDGNGASLNDTWLYDIAAGAWSLLDIESPAPRFGSAIAEDRAKRRLYLFGGEDGVTFYNDTWRFDFKSMTWRLQDDGASIAPTARYGLGGSLDDNDKFVISHGFTFEGRFDDTWTFDTREKIWTDTSPAAETRPLKRCLHELAHDPESGQIILFGGCSSGYGPCPQGDLWSYDPQDGVWTEITPASGPSARSNPAMVWDEAGGRALLFGGQSDAGQVADLWEGRFADGGFTWTELFAVDAPSPRSSHDAVILNGVLYVFGGTSTTNGTFNDLWRLSL
jgi:hypothetical protein